MSDLNLSQIQTRLNELFVTYGERRLIFWFDPQKEFEEEIDDGKIVLDDAKIYKLEPHTQFETKHFFEIVDTNNSYLIYAPFAKIDDSDENNHLLSILKYSSLFNADRISLVMKQLNISINLHTMVEYYGKFFSAKTRISSFEKFVTTEIKSKEELEITLMAVLTKANAAQFYSVLQALFVEYANDSSELYDQLVNFNLQEVFWAYISKYYSYNAAEPTISKLVTVFFVNTFYSQIRRQKLPDSLSEYKISDQTTAIISFMDGVMNDSRYNDSFDQLSYDTYNLINGDKLLDGVTIEELIDADIFEPIHNRVIKYYVKQLLSGDITPIINNITMQNVIVNKQRSHFGEKYKDQYYVILNAQKLLNYVKKINTNQFSLVVKEYEETSYMMDQFYRKFIWYLDQVSKQETFLELHVFVEKRYKAFLDEIGLMWNDQLNFNERSSMLDFYDDFAKSKTKTVIIISDALRYEAAKEIQDVLQKEKKYTTKMNTLFSVLPSVTEFGKAASLRSGSESYDYVNDMDIRINNMKTNGTINRDKILKNKNLNSIAITYNDVITKSNAKELRELFNGKEVIYIYHDEIDKTGDHGQEIQVFNAVEKTINDLKSLLPYVSNGANVYRFVITSDHGFIYTRSKVEEYNKIDNPATSDIDRVERRFIISKNNYEKVGVSSMRLGDVLRNEDNRYVNFPKTSAIFKKAGGGQNYIHGGSSPQEVIIPVLEINVARGSAQKEQVTIQLMTAKRKVIGLEIVLEFYQVEAISDSVTKAQYSIYFEDIKQNRVTNETIYFADSIDSSASERFTKFNFDFVNRSYETNEKVYLIIKKNDTKIETERIEFIMDNPFFQ